MIKYPKKGKIRVDRSVRVSDTVLALLHWQIGDEVSLWIDDSTINPNMGRLIVEVTRRLAKIGE